MIQGKQREQKETTNTKYIGFTKVVVRAINPTRHQLNVLLGKEDSDDDKEFDYLKEDKDGNKMLRLSFWLWDEKLDKFFPHSFNLTDKVRVSNDGSKTQYINSVCQTGWADSEDNLADFFKNFTDRKTKEVIGEKEFRPALSGEEELGTFLRGWLARLDWNDPGTKVFADTKALFKEDFSSLQGQIDGDYDAPFVILTGVKTDESDPEKQYQQVYGKQFLPASFLKNIEDNKFSNDFAKKTWQKFVDEVEGDYGFKSYFELVPLKEYNKEDDPATQPLAADSTPKNSKY